MDDKKDDKYDNKSNDKYKKKDDSKDKDKKSKDSKMTIYYNRAYQGWGFSLEYHLAFVTFLFFNFQYFSMKF